MKPTIHRALEIFRWLTTQWVIRESLVEYGTYNSCGFCGGYAGAEEGSEDITHESDCLLPEAEELLANLDFSATIIKDKNGNSN